MSKVELAGTVPPVTRMVLEPVIAKGIAMLTILVEDIEHNHDDSGGAAYAYRPTAGFMAEVDKFAYACNCAGLRQPTLDEIGRLSARLHKLAGLGRAA